MQRKRSSGGFAESGGEGLVRRRRPRGFDSAVLDWSRHYCCRRLCLMQLSGCNNCHGIPNFRVNPSIALLQMLLFGRVNYCCLRRAVQGKNAKNLDVITPFPDQRSSNTPIFSHTDRHVRPTILIIHIRHALSLMHQFMILPGRGEGVLGTEKSPLFSRSPHMTNNPR